MAGHQHGVLRRIRFWLIFFLWQYWFAVGFFGIALLLWVASSFGWVGYAALAAALAMYYACISGSTAHKTSKGDDPDSRLNDTFSEDFAQYFGGMPVSVLSYSALSNPSIIELARRSSTRRGQSFMATSSISSQLGLMAFMATLRVYCRGQARPSTRNSLTWPGNSSEWWPV